MPPHRRPSTASTTSSTTTTTTNTNAPRPAGTSTPPDPQAFRLAPEDLATLRFHQQLAARNRGGGGSSSSAAASTAGSSAGRLLLDPTSLTQLGRHFDGVMEAIAGRIEQLHEATETATTAQTQRGQAALAAADAEIARFTILLRQIDELEAEFAKLRRLREMVRGFRSRVEGLERRLG